MAERQSARGDGDADAVKAGERFTGQNSRKPDELQFQPCADAMHILPAPRAPDDPAAPMFDAKRDYLTQIAHYHAWQGRGEGAA